MNAFTSFGDFASIRSLRTCNFDQITLPGAYVENRWGTLFRVPEGVLPSVKHPSSKRVAGENWLVTRLTYNPFVPLALARRIAAQLGLPVSF